MFTVTDILTGTHGSLNPDYPGAANLVLREVVIDSRQATRSERRAPARSLDWRVSSGSAAAADLETAAICSDRGGSVREGTGTCASSRRAGTRLKAPRVALSAA